MTDYCPNCGETFKRVGSHWAQSDCNYPKLNEKQKELIIGILMGDGHIDKKSKCKNGNCRMTVKMINKKFLNWLESKLQPITKNLKLVKTAEESAKAVRKSGFYEDAEANDYSDIYRLRTTKHPYLTELRNWYKTGEKVFPSNLKLTPTILKMWYVCDGSLPKRDTKTKLITISASNEIKNKKKLIQYFEDLNVSPNFTQNQLEFDKNDTRKIFEYIGDPPQGFQYKWI